MSHPFQKSWGWWARAGPSTALMHVPESKCEGREEATAQEPHGSSNAPATTSTPRFISDGVSVWEWTWTCLKIFFNATYTHHGVQWASRPWPLSFIHSTVIYWGVLWPRHPYTADSLLSEFSFKTWGLFFCGQIQVCFAPCTCHGNNLWCENNTRIFHSYLSSLVIVSWYFPIKKQQSNLKPSLIRIKTDNETQWLRTQTCQSGCSGHALTLSITNST